MKRLALTSVDKSPLAESDVSGRWSSLRLGINKQCYSLPGNIAYSSQNGLLRDPKLRFPCLDLNAV